jgi:hypothetical protein
MVCYDVPVVVSHDELCCARGVNHGVLFCASGGESLCVILSQWFVCHGELC